MRAKGYFDPSAGFYLPAGYYKLISEAGDGPDGTEYYVEITIDAAQVSTTLTDFPVYVDLGDMPAGFWSNVQSDGGDIRVTEADGSTRRAVDLVAIDTGAETGELHFLAGSVSSSSATTFRLWFKSSASLSQPASDAAYGRQAVWGDYLMVLHSGGGADAVGDYDGSAGGGVSFGGATGKVGKATDYDGTDDRSQHGSGLGEGESILTVSGWLKPVTVGGNERVLHHNGTFSVFLTDAASGALRFVEYGGVRAVDTSAGSVSTGVWTHFLFSITPGTATAAAFINGSSDLAANNMNSEVSSFPVAADDAFVGVDEDLTTGFYEGLIDELRVANAVRSAAWAAAEYSNQNNPGGFYTVGSVVT